jgi:septal ring factor EnvC (AmiA/AmiB activator)
MMPERGGPYPGWIKKHRRNFPWPPDSPDEIGPSFIAFAAARDIAFVAGRAARITSKTCGATAIARNVRQSTDPRRTPRENRRITRTTRGRTMDDKERRALEREVEAHMRRIERIQETLHDSEENLRQVVDAPPELVREVSTLKMELRGRKAALAVGLSLLGIYQD